MSQEGSIIKTFPEEKTTVRRAIKQDSGKI